MAKNLYRRGECGEHGESDMGDRRERPFDERCRKGGTGMALTMKVAEKKPRVFVVSLAGKLDGTTFADLERKIDYLIGEGGAMVLTLDMEGLEFISSMGIRVVFKAKKEMAKRGGSFFMASVPPPIVKAFEIIDALPSMKIFSGIAEMDAYLEKIQKQT